MKQLSGYGHLKAANKHYGKVFFSLILLLVFVSIMVSNFGPVLAHDPGLFAGMKTLAYILAGVLLVLAYALVQKKIHRIPQEWPLEDKMAHYRKATSLRLWLIGAAGLLISLFFLLTADTNLILVLAIVLIFLILSRPGPFKAGSDLKLSEEDKKELLQ